MGRMTNLTKRQKETFLVVLSAVLFLAIVAYSYLTIYAPVKEVNNQMELTTANERDVLFALRKQKANSGKPETSSSQQLQRKVPVKPLEDVVLLQVGKAEIKSDSIVQDVTFTVSEFVLENLPENENNVHQLLTEVTLEADSYSSVKKFINEIEQMDRLFIVDEISFTGNEEIREEEIEAERIQLTVAFSAFYRPDLVDLQHESPKVNAPSPAGKVDPMPFNDGTKEGDE